MSKCLEGWCVLSVQQRLAVITVSRPSWTTKVPHGPQRSCLIIYDFRGVGFKVAVPRLPPWGAAVGLSPESFWFLILIFFNKMKVMCLHAQEIQKVERGTKCLKATFIPPPRSLSLLRVSKIQMPRPHSPELWFSRKGWGLGNCILTCAPGDAWALGVVRLHFF